MYEGGDTECIVIYLGHGNVPHLGQVIDSHFMNNRVQQVQQSSWDFR